MFLLMALETGSSDLVRRCLSLVKGKHDASNFAHHSLNAHAGALRSNIGSPKV